MDKMKNALFTIVRLVLAALLVIIVGVLVLCLSLRAVFARELYTRAATSDAVVSALHTDILEHLESECLFYDLPYDTMKTALSVDTIKAMLHEQANGMYEALMGGTQMPSVTPDAASFKAAIDSFFETLPIEERPLDPDASQTIATELSKSMALVIGMGIGDKMLKTVQPFFSRAHNIVDVGVWLLLVVVLLTAVSMIPVRSSVRERAYSTAGTLFIGSAAIAVPTWLFAGLDFPSKLAIGESALRELVHAVLNTIIRRMTVISTVSFVITAVLLIGVVVWIVKTKKTVS